MSLYNALFGVNQLAPLLLECLGLTPSKTGRFRDCYLSKDKIVVYTRNGGGNREEYQPVLDTLAKHPNYLRDYDDDFDCTYCSIEFSFPEAYKTELEELAKVSAPDTPADKWKLALEALREVATKEASR